MICWFHKRTVARSLDADATPPAGTLRHLQHCAICSAFYETQSRIVRKLVAGAGSCRLESSPWLERRIIAELRREPEGAALATRRFPSGWPIAAAAACLLLGAFLWVQSRPALDPPVGANHPGSAAAAADLALLLELPKAAGVSELGRELKWPLDTELKLAVTDAKAAMNYLADNVLPESLRRAAFNKAAP
jgi:hypothetical protein